MIRVHILDTGRVKIHTRQVDPHPNDKLRLPATLFDRNWTEWLSVWSFAIEHPHGVVVVDAGQDPDHVAAWWDVYTKVAVQFETTPADALVARLTEVGLDPGDVRHHVFTHLHVDHVGSGPLPGVRPTVSEAEWRAATRPGAALRGYRRAGFPDNPILATDDLDLYGDGTIRLLATPGHTHGHQSVLVTPTDGPQILMTGDAVYSEQALLDGIVDGVGVSAEQARASITRLQHLCETDPTIVLPTHDPAARDRLSAGQGIDHSLNLAHEGPPACHPGDMWLGRISGLGLVTLYLVLTMGPAPAPAPIGFYTIRAVSKSNNTFTIEKVRPGHVRAFKDRRW